MKKVFVILLILMSACTYVFSQCTCTAGCSSLIVITMPFTKNGTGEFCYQASCIGGPINSWNMDKLVINWVDFTNKWADASALPAAASDGYYYIYYKGSYSYSHFEATGSCSGGSTNPPSSTTVPVNTPAPTIPQTDTPVPTATPAPTGISTSVPTIAPTDVPGATTPPTQTQNSLGFCGCSMAENIAQGYQTVGGRRMWPPYGTGGMVVQSWTDANSSSWQLFDQQSAKYGKPNAVWVQICIFASQGATYDEVKKIIANARQHAASGATIYITGQPLYESGWVCDLAGANGPQLTDNLAKQAGTDSTQDANYLGTFGPLGQGTTSDSCHANAAGQQLLGNQAVGYFGL